MSGELKEYVSTGKYNCEIASEKNYGKAYVALEMGDEELLSKRRKQKLVQLNILGRRTFPEETPGVF